MYASSGKTGELGKSLREKSKDKAQNFKNNNIAIYTYYLDVEVNKRIN